MIFESLCTGQSVVWTLEAQPSESTTNFDQILSQQILMARNVVYKSTDHAEPHFVGFF